MAHRRRAVLARLYTPAGRVLSAFTAFSLVLTSGLGVLSRHAGAADLPRVLVLPYAPIYDVLPRNTGVKAAEVLSNELRSSEQMQLVTLKADKLAAAPAPKTSSPGPGKDTAALTEARERAAKAEEFTRKLKFRQAADELEKVIALYEGQHPYIDFNDLVAAHLSVAVAYFRLGLDSEGEKALAQVVRLVPDKRLDAEKYPPVFIRAFDNVNKKIQKAPRATLQIEATSPGAAIILDGREVGKSPLIIKDVIKGVHFLKVVPAGGGDAWSNRVDAAAGATVKLAPDVGAAGGPLAELVGMLVRNTIDDAVINRAVAIAEQAPADFVVLGGVHKEGDGIVVSSHLLKVATKKTSLLQRVVFDQEMLGAGIEIYKVGTDITNKLDVFGEGERLPAKVARDALAPSGGGGKVLASVSVGAAPPPETTPPPDTGDRVVRKNDKPTDTPKAAPEEKPAPVKTEVRKVTAASGEPELIPLEPLGPGEEKKVQSSGSKTWVWIVVAVAVVAVGGGVGAYFGISEGTKKVTGAGTITW